MKKSVITLIGLAALVSSLAQDNARPYGSSPSVEPSDSSLLANAQKYYQSGNYEPAIAGFECFLKSNPKHHQAHFQLAVALQEQRKDYLGALVHYRLYLDLCPGGEKASQAAYRMKACKDMLLEEHARKSGRPFLRNTRDGEVARLLTEKSHLLTEVATLRVKNENLKAMLGKLESYLDLSDKMFAKLRAEMKKVRAEADESETKVKHCSSLNPTDKAILDDDSDDGPSFSSSEVKAQIAQAKVEDESGPARPPAIVKPPLIVNSSPGPDPKPVTSGVCGKGLDSMTGGGKKPSGSERPDTYTVQPGDVLQSIAERFYGDKSKWRDIKRANMDSIPADGRVKVGQIIKLP